MTTYYQSTLSKRLSRLVKLGAELKKRPLSDVHQETGMYVFEVLCVMAHAAAVTELELRLEAGKAKR